jgi:hypothetical protein
VRGLEGIEAVDLVLASRDVEHVAGAEAVAAHRGTSSVAVAIYLLFACP